MNFKLHFTDWLGYDRWAMDRILKRLSESQLDGSPESDLFVHIALAQLVWADRMHGVKPNRSAFDKRGCSLAEAEATASQGRAALEGLLAEFAETRYMESFDYKDSRGNPYRSTYFHVLTHVFNHGAHHRGQINMMLRRREIEPPVLDFIVYQRSP